MFSTYEFRLSLLLAGTVFIVAASYDPTLKTGLVWALTVLASHAFCSFFGASYLFETLPINKSAQSDYSDFVKQYYMLKNLYTHPLTILSGLVVYWYAGPIAEQLTTLGWPSLMYSFGLLMLVLAVPARLWGSWVSLGVDDRMDGYRAGISAGEYEAE